MKQSEHFPIQIRILLKFDSECQIENNFTLVQMMAQGVKGVKSYYLN